MRLVLLAKQHPLQELQRHLAILHSLRSRTLGGPTGLVVMPVRLAPETKQDVWALRPSDTDEYVFCHNDVSEANVIVDPETYAIKAIIDWEYAGFWPEFFEGPVYTRVGPRKTALNDDPANVTRMLEFLRSREVQTGL